MRFKKKNWSLKASPWNSPTRLDPSISCGFWKAGLPMLQSELKTIGKRWKTLACKQVICWKPMAKWFRATSLWARNRTGVGSDLQSWRTGMMLNDVEWCLCGKGIKLLGGTQGFTHPNRINMNIKTNQVGSKILCPEGYFCGVRWQGWNRDPNAFCCPDVGLSSLPKDVDTGNEREAKWKNRAAWQKP